MNEYLRMVEKAQSKRIELTNEQKKNIKELYKEVSKDLGKRLKLANKNSLNERWLKDYQKQFKNDIKDLNKILRKDIEDSMLKSAEYASGIQIDFFDLMDIKYELNIKETFSNMFSKIPQEALQELINGSFYKDGKGLSKRLWFNGLKANAEFDYIIQKGLLEKKSIYDLAKDLEKYVNPDVKKDWNFKRIYPSVGNKKIEYNSFRLAVTSISHAYQLSMQRSCKANPFVEKIEWHTSNSHRGPCSLCQSREGKKYNPDELPLDHPNGICYFTPVIDKTLDDIGSELHDWIHGGDNAKLDNWYNDKGNNNNILSTNKELEKIQDYKEPLGKRHNFNSINKKSIAKENNTIIMPNVDIKKDIEDIKNGLYNKEEEIYIANNRKYGQHDGRFYPIEGEGFITLDRNEYKILIKMKTESNNPMIKQILKNMGATDETIQKISNIIKVGEKDGK